uniref:Gylcosyl hydrolase 115 C-terminal domain-containing protein n=1 Tax=mine drainage metagenome TaxID=410659 RepID=E6PY85_9ZZZZ
MDIERVTGLKPVLVADSISRGKVAAEGLVLIGTLGHSALIDRLVARHKIDTSAIAGKWESTLTEVVDHPLPGVRRALVIVGSDKRGTIFGMYDLSEEIGVSPWYWWADVPIQHHDALFVAAGRHVQGEPAVRYRGIFLNDEAPALTGWVNTRYGGYNHKFYVHVFELLLRLRANYLWPAMWGSAFNEDDPENPRLADMYGIVMGTSHHEPMLRAQQEWKRHGTGPWDYATNSAVLDKFWTEGIVRNGNYESTITLGMRGDGDMPMTEGQNITLLEKIVADQRKILADHPTPTLQADPQVWALYKEVQAYYEKGMRVPEDVTLLWCDDNWGNIRRLPTLAERARSGGAGIYYHFDYVGDPRNYKWLNTNPIPKVWEQMHLALEYDADRIWVVNVGDLKPMEFPIEFFLTYARNPERWGKDHLDEYTRLWAAREFGPEHASEIASLIAGYTKLNGLRKPELLEPTTFSLINYNEADHIETAWTALEDKAEAVSKELPANAQDAYFELVEHPILASGTVAKLYITAGRNHLYATEGRVSTNALADQARALFAEDAAIEERYNHQVAGGKWNHMMDQTHLGYTYWQEPPVNVMPAVSQVQPWPDARMGVLAEGIATPLAPQRLSFDSFARQTRFLDIFNRGAQTFQFSAISDQPWIHISSTEGSVTTEKRLQVSLDWSKVPAGTSSGTITIAQTEPQAHGLAIRIAVSAFAPSSPTIETLNGFVESDGYVAIEAEDTTARTVAGKVHWESIPDYGATRSGMAIFPVTAPSVLTPLTAARLDYRMYLFDAGPMHLEATIGPTLNFVPGRGLRFAVWFDDQKPRIVDALADLSDATWAKVVSDEVRRVATQLSIPQPGYHILHFAMVDPGLVLERLVVSSGKTKPSYLGPPESPHQIVGNIQHP